MDPLRPWDQNALIDDLYASLSNGDQITLLLGSGVTAPIVPGLEAIIRLADQYASSVGDEGELPEALTQSIEELGPEATASDVYLAYRRTFTDRRSPGEFDVIAQQAVLEAYRHPDLPISPLATHGIWQRVDLRLGERVENDLDWWVLPPGVQAIGRLLARRTEEFDNRVLTTNFDPLIELAIRLADRPAVSVPVDPHGRRGRRLGGEGAIQVFHLHGFWRPVDDTDDAQLLHDPGPRADALNEAVRTVADLISGDRVVVVGYSGWDSVVTRALRAVRDIRPINVWWALHADELNAERQPPAAELGHLVTFYSGVTSDTLFTRLADKLRIPAVTRNADPRRRIRHLDWERELFSQPGNTPPRSVLQLLRQLERRYGWGVDWAGEPRVPAVLFWPVRLRQRASLINAVQAVAAGGLARRGVRVIVCLDDFGVGDRQTLSNAFSADIRRWMQYVDPQAEPTIASLRDFIDNRPQLAFEDPERLHHPTDPWWIARIFYGERNPSLYSVLAAIKVVPHIALRDLEQHSATIVQALLSKNANRLLTPLTTWAYLHHVLKEEPAESVMALAGSDERLLWEQWREHFGLGGTLLYNPYIKSLTNESGMVRWSTDAELRAHLARARELPAWDQEGAYVHWLVQNALLLPRYLTDQDFPEAGGYRLDSWPAFAAALEKGAPVIELLASEVSRLYLAR